MLLKLYCVFDSHGDLVKLEALILQVWEWPESLNLLHEPGDANTAGSEKGKGRGHLLERGRRQVRERERERARKGEKQEWKVMEDDKGQTD